MRRRCAVTLLVGGVLLGLGCGAPEATLAPEAKPSWEEFRAQAVQDEGDVFVVDVDQAVEGNEGLRAYYDSAVGQDLGRHEGGLLVYHLNGMDVKWSSTQAQNLTYCVSSSSFGSRYPVVVSVMNTAAAAWEACGRVNFIHLSAYDSNCTASQTGVLFDVRQTSTTSYLARAFFPNSSRSGRNILISSSAFGNTAPYTLAGVLRHELGHVLGLRHEHIRLATTGCPEDRAWRALTPYDPHSIMIHPECVGGSSTWNLSLSSQDCAGMRTLYP